MYDAQRVADYLEIQNLNAQYNYFADTGNGESYANLYVEDGEFDVVGFRVFAGHAELAACASVAANKTVHVTANPYIEFDGDRATQRIRLLSCMRVADGSVNEFVNSGYYFDELRRTPDGWRYVTRRVVADLNPAELLKKNGTIDALEAIDSH